MDGFLHGVTNLPLFACPLSRPVRQGARGRGSPLWEGYSFALL